MSISILLIITIIFFFVIGLPLCFSADQRYEKCLSSPQRCGYGPSLFRSNITYPFWGDDIDKPVYCGQSPFALSCKGSQNLTVEIANLTLHVVSTELDNKTMTVADESFFEDGSCPKTLEFYGDEQFTLSPNTEKMDLHTCSDPNNMSTTSLPSITCTPSDGHKTTYLYLPSNVSDRGCQKAGEVPVLKSAKNDLHELKITLAEALKGGFELRYIIDDQVCRYCINSTGVCGSDAQSGKFRCLCKDRPHKSSCKDEDKTRWKSFPLVTMTKSFMFLGSLVR